MSMITTRTERHRGHRGIAVSCSGGRAVPSSKAADRSGTIHPLLDRGAASDADEPQALGVGNPLEPWSALGTRFLTGRGVERSAPRPPPPVRGSSKPHGRSVPDPLVDEGSAPLQIDEKIVARPRGRSGRAMGRHLRVIERRHRAVHRRPPVGDHVDPAAVDREPDRGDVRQEGQRPHHLGNPNDDVIR